MKSMLGRDSEDEDLCKNFDDKRSYFGRQNSTLRSVVPMAMFVFIRDVIAEKLFQASQRYLIGGHGLAVEIDESMFGLYTS